MLVLTRKPGETIFIGDNIAITVSRIRGQQVAIAIGAPKEVNIVREELVPEGSPLLDMLT